ncbi:MAG: sulfite exporter TauE/SafE family protein [Bacilli bacterium]|nr:sulfite exporter TauE/SafE family protein [Bacilli bacterium]
MSIAEVLFVIVAFVANIVQAITGFAGTVLAMPLSIDLVGYNVARPILNLVAIVICLIVVIFNFKNIEWKKLLFLIVFVGIGFGLGFLIQRFAFDGERLLKVYGTIICLIALTYLFFDMEGKQFPKWLQPIILILAGIIHFLYTSGGPLVVLFAASTIKDKNKFRTTLSFMWVILNSIIFTTNIIDGQFTPRVWMLSAIVIGSCFVSLILGKLILKKLDRKMFMRLTYILLFISGVSAVM